MFLKLESTHLAGCVPGMPKVLGSNHPGTLIFLRASNLNRGHKIISYALLGENRLQGIPPSPKGFRVSHQISWGIFLSFLPLHLLHWKIWKNVSDFLERQVRFSAIWPPDVSWLSFFIVLPPTLFLSRTGCLKFPERSRLSSLRSFSPTIPSASNILSVILSDGYRIVFQNPAREPSSVRLTTQCRHNSGPL